MDTTAPPEMSGLRPVEGQDDNTQGQPPEHAMDESLPTNSVPKSGKPGVLSAASALTSLIGASSTEGGDSTQESDSIAMKNKDEQIDKDDSGQGEQPKGSGNAEPPVAEEEIPMTFPQRLMEMLSNEEHKDIMAWLPHGRGFMILHKKRFAEEVLPKYFKKTKFTSFTRKLNRWNFTRVTRGPETGAYYHKFFQRDNQRLCMQMYCQSARHPKSSQHLASSNAMLSTPHMTSRLGMNEAMFMLQLGSPQQQQASAQVPNSGAAAVSGQLLDPNMILLRQQELEQQRQALLLKQQQTQQQLQQQQQQLAALAGIGVPNQQIMLQNPPSSDAPFRGGGSGTPAPTPAMGSPDATTNAMQSKSVVDAAIKALERSNASGYLSMIMAQEKAQAQMAALGGSGTTPDVTSIAELQRQQANILMAQQQQLELFTKQQMMQAAAMTAKQQQQQSQKAQHQQQQGLQAPPRLLQPGQQGGADGRAKAA